MTAIICDHCSKRYVTSCPFEAGASIDYPWRKKVNQLGASLRRISCSAIHLVGVWGTAVAAAVRKLGLNRTRSVPAGSQPTEFVPPHNLQTVSRSKHDAEDTRPRSAKPQCDACLQANMASLATDTAFSLVSIYNIPCQGREYREASYLSPRRGLGRMLTEVPHNQGMKIAEWCQPCNGLILLETRCLGCLAGLSSRGKL